MSQFAISDYYFSRKKRLFDAVLACICIVVLSPIFCIISVGIVVTSGFPIVFSQQRVGKDKKVFLIYKFRTMYKNAHIDQKKFWKFNESPFPAFKLSNDPRFVGIGRWLSKTGLDELPQLVNILRGEMSFIGPRPLPIAEAKKLTGSWNFRYAVRPGIISLWALSDKRHKSLKHWQKLEKETLKKASIFHDFQQLLSTVKIIFQ